MTVSLTSAAYKLPGLGITDHRVQCRTSGVAETKSLASATPPMPRFDSASATGTGRHAQPRRPAAAQ